MDSTTASDKEDADRGIWRGFLSEYLAALAGDSSVGGGEGDRLVRMHANNPRFVPKNWMLQSAIEKAEAGDYSAVSAIAEASDHVYDPDWFAENDRGFVAMRQRDAPEMKDKLYNT